MDNTENRIIDLMAVLKESLAAKKPAGEPTQAGEASVNSRSDTGGDGGVDRPSERDSRSTKSAPDDLASPVPASPAEEVERNIRHLAWDVEALEKLLTEEQRDSDEWFNLKANVAVLRAPSSVRKQCVACKGSGTFQEHHGPGLNETLSCDVCEGTEYEVEPSAPRGPSAEAVEPSTESKVIALMSALKTAIDHPWVSEGPTEEGRT